MLKGREQTLYGGHFSVSPTAAEDSEKYADNAFGVSCAMRLVSERENSDSIV